MFGDVSLGVVVAAALPAWWISLGAFAWNLSLGIVHLETFAWDLPLGI